MGRSAIGGDVVSGNDGSGQLVRKPPPKRTVTAFAVRTVVPEAR